MVVRLILEEDMPHEFQCYAAGHHARRFYGCFDVLPMKAISFLNARKLLQVLHYGEKKKARVLGFSLVMD
jgi:hypothetical protein